MRLLYNITCLLFFFILALARAFHCSTIEEVGTKRRFSGALVSRDLCVEKRSVASVKDQSFVRNNMITRHTTRQNFLKPRYASSGVLDNEHHNESNFKQVQYTQQPQMTWRRRLKAALSSFTESGLITYLTISIVWYSTGMTLALAGMQKAELASQAGAASSGVFKMALRRVVTAWGLTFVASQVVAGFKVIAAGLLSPIAALGLHKFRKMLPSWAPYWLAPFLITAALLGIFAALIFSLTIREAATAAVSTGLLESSSSF